MENENKIIVSCLRVMGNWNKKIIIHGMTVGKEILRSYYESSLATKVAETMYKPMK